jgi:hypothetical protein
MLRKLLTSVVLVAAVLLVSRPDVGAQPPGFQIPKPGPEHKVLEPLVGTFKAKVKMYMEPGKPPTESEGTMNRKWILDGRYLQEEFEGKFFDTPFKGQGMLTYDPAKKQYVATWADSMSLSITMMQGTYDDKTKTLTYVYEETDPSSGKKMKARDVSKIVDNDHQTFDMYRTLEGMAEFKVMEITYTRVKK